MRAPASARQFDRRASVKPQQRRGHRKRHGADPVLPHRREFFAAAGVRSAAGRETPALPENIAPRSAARCACRAAPAWQDASARRRGFPAAPPAFRQARPASSSSTRSSPEIGVHRFDQPRIAIDQQRRRPSSGMIKSTDNAPCQPSCGPIFSRQRAHDRPATRFA